MKHSSVITGAWVCVLAFCAVALGQDYEIERYTTDGGGAISTGGEYILSATIGQRDSGKMWGGDYALAGGFWGGVAPIGRRRAVRA